MLSRETVKARLESGGISYTEFSYQILQANDFLELYRRYGCTLQIGGSDQWGNLVSGVDLIRRVTGDTVHALATPLITRPDGTKYGKSEGDAIWLSPELMSPYAFHQYWLNRADAEVPEPAPCLHVPDQGGDRGPGAGDRRAARGAGPPSECWPMT